MALDKFISLEGGRRKLEAAIKASTGAADADKIIATGPDGKIDITLLPTGIGADIKVIETADALNQGAFVNFFDDTGTDKVRNADATNDRSAMGYVKDAYLVAENALVYFEGLNDDLSGLTIGGEVYLGAGGAVKQTAPVNPSDVIHQFLGWAVSATEVSVEMQPSILLV